MPYPTGTNFQPSSPYRLSWTLVPQTTTLKLSNHKTKSMYSSLSPAIPIFYILMFIAIGLDVYLALAILARSGVSLALVIGSIIADLFLAICPFLFEGFWVKDWNHVVVENDIFRKELECMTKKKGEDDDDFNRRKATILTASIPQLKSYQRNGKILRWFLILCIFALAAWKIYTFNKVIPPGISIFSTVNGKIVITFSLLCAIFHILGSEKAVAHLRFYLISKPEFKKFLRTHDGAKPIYQRSTIPFVGNYLDVESQSKNVKIVNIGDLTFLDYNPVIWDNEIQEVINKTPDENAKRGIAIACKETQIV